LIRLYNSCYSDITFISVKLDCIITSYCL